MQLTPENVQEYLRQSIINLCNAGTLAIERHQHERSRNPQHAATSYLRAAVQIARQMKRIAPRYPILWESALALLDQIAEEVDREEQLLFRAGGNTAGYAAVWAAAEALRIEIVEQYRMEMIDRSQQVEGEGVEVSEDAPPALPRPRMRHMTLRPKMPELPNPPAHYSTDDRWSDDPLGLAQADAPGGQRVPLPLASGA